MLLTGKYEMQVEMLDFSSNYKRALYNRFSVNEGTTIDDLEFVDDPNANGFVRDALSSVAGEPFSVLENGDVCALERETSGWFT